MTLEEFNMVFDGAAGARYTVNIPAGVTNPLEYAAGFATGDISATTKDGVLYVIASGTSSFNHPDAIYVGTV